MGVHVDFKLEGALAEQVEAATSRFGQYLTAEEYIRDLIRRDAEREYADFLAFKATLQEAFATPEEQYVLVGANEVIDRNKRRHAAE